MKQQTKKLLYWLAPVIGALLQFAFLAPTFFINGAKDADFLPTIPMALAFYLLLNIGTLAIAYGFLWAMNRFRSHSKVLFVLFSVLYVGEWALMGFFIEQQTAPLYFTALVFLWVLLFLVPLFVASRQLLFKKQ